MKILYDHQIFSMQTYGGISRYFFELINQLDNINNIEISASLLLSNNHYISDSKLIKHNSFFSNKDFIGKLRIISEINKLESIRQLKKQDFDIFHPTYYDTYFLEYIGEKPFVLTVYDMIHEKFKDMFSLKDRTSEQKKMLVQKATKIIAISESTKKDLILLYGIEESKIEVIYLGNSLLTNTNTSIQVNIPEKFILFVGSRGLYKNFERFIRGIHQLLRDDKELSIVCVGGGVFSSFELQLFESLEISLQLNQYNLNDELLSLFYKKAKVFVFPSLYEGFGIPVLEAFANGCPLVCSNCSSLPEIASNGAEYFDPYSEESIRNTIRSVLENDLLRLKLISNGSERIKEFSWKLMAEKTNLLYQRILI